jgi:hypothetical protein
LSATRCLVILHLPCPFGSLAFYLTVSLGHSLLSLGHNKQFTLTCRILQPCHPNLVNCRKRLYLSLMPSYLRLPSSLSTMSQQVRRQSFLTLSTEPDSNLKNQSSVRDHPGGLQLVGRHHSRYDVILQGPLALMRVQQHQERQKGPLLRDNPRSR